MVSIGSLTLSIVHPREVFKPVILMNAAPGFASIIIHLTIPHPVNKIASSPADSSRGRISQASPCSTILSSPTHAATALLTRSGPVPEGLGLDEPDPSLGVTQDIGSLGPFFMQ